MFPAFVALGENYPYAELHNRMADIVDLTDSKWFLDLYSDVYKGLDANRLSESAYDPHPNEEAHRLAGVAIGQFLMKNGLLDIDSIPVTGVVSPSPDVVGD
jgi:hypothetical protein